jgi:hypothetical protein
MASNAYISKLTTLLLLALTPCSALCKEIHNLSVQVVDLGGADTPIGATGQVSFREDLSGQVVKTQWAMNIQMANTSSKTILAYEVLIRAVPDYGTAVSYTARADYFFRMELSFVPGAQQTISEARSDTHEIPYKEASEPSVPKAFFEVVFVEFADGSRIGTSKWGTQLSAVRQQTIEALNSVMKQSQESGETGLRNALTEKFGAQDNSGFVRGVLNDIRTTLDTKGFVEALKQINRFLQSANEHTAAL